MPVTEWDDEKKEWVERPNFLPHDGEEVINDFDKSCPFCGSRFLTDFRVEHHLFRTEYTTRCGDCHASGPPVYEGEGENHAMKAQEFWNKRSD